MKGYENGTQCCELWGLFEHEMGDFGTGTASIYRVCSPADVKQDVRKASWVGVFRLGTGIVRYGALSARF